ncbi:MAG: WD40 repeat domain-containing protein, partial [Oscillochloris sp.]|nr:WD40 repeat domain-containing protein [Oscillochloris sp.]
LSFSPDGQALIAGDEGAGLTRWAPGDLAGGPIALNTARDSVAVVAISPDQRYAATATFDNQVQLWDLHTPNALPVDVGGSDEAAFALAFSPDSAQLAVGLNSGVVALWATDNPGAEPVTLPGNGQTVTALVYSADGAWLAAGAGDGSMQIWERSRPEAAPRRLLGHNTMINSLAFSPDAQRLASASDDLTARVWDVASATSLYVLSGHSQPVTASAFSPNGRSLATASTDKTVRIWDLTSPGAAPVVLVGHESTVNTVAFSPDGSLLASAGSDGWVRLWPMRSADMAERACATAGRNLSNAEWQQAFGDQPYRKTCAGLPISASLIDDAATLAGYGEITRAMALVGRVNALGLAAEIPANSWGDLCRQGSLAGHAAEAATACDQALALAPDDGQFYDSCGLNRALRGDLAGARSDFLAYISWAEQSGQGEDTIAMRQAWVEALAADANPFDAALLEHLRQQ